MYMKSIAAVEESKPVCLVWLLKCGSASLLKGSIFSLSDSLIRLESYPRLRGHHTQMGGHIPELVGHFHRHPGVGYGLGKKHMLIINVSPVSYD